MTLWPQLVFTETIGAVVLFRWMKRLILLVIMACLLSGCAVMRKVGNSRWGSGGNPSAGHCGGHGR